MLTLLILGILVVAVFYSAARIILGWILPKPTLARFDAALGGAVTLIWKISVVVFAGLILWLIFFVEKPTP